MAYWGSNRIDSTDDLMDIRETVAYQRHEEKKQMHQAKYDQEQAAMKDRLMHTTYERYGGMVTHIDPGRTMSFIPSVLQDTNMTFDTSKNRQAPKTTKRKVKVDFKLAIPPFGPWLVKEVAEQTTKYFTWAWGVSKPTVMKAWKAIYNF
tara:strand:+ start:24717 stop:25163 length:447 start_codon:yes stop_codon:yes gene_type:complete